MGTTTQLGAYGLFTLISPYAIDNVNYKITGIALFSNLVENGIDVYNTYYSAYGLTSDQYQTDLNNGSYIVTMESDNGLLVNVPNTYIANIPVQTYVPYSRIVLSIELGELPDTLDLSQLTNDLQVVANNYVGVTSMPKIHKIPIQTLYSYQDYLDKEIIRNAQIAEYISFYTGKQNADINLADAKTRIEMLEDALVNANQLLHEHNIV